MDSELSKTIYAIICEGSAEKAIIDLLIENNCVFFDVDNLLYGEALKIRSAKNFESKIRFTYNNMILYRIIDSRTEQFVLSKIHSNKIKVINCYTRPEIEMLVIIAEKKYAEYLRKYKSSLKPCEYVKNILKIKNIKTYNEVRNYFSNINLLLDVLNEYESITKSKGESIIRLLKDGLIK